LGWNNTNVKKTSADKHKKYKGVTGGVSKLIGLRFDAANVAFTIQLKAQGAIRHAVVGMDNIKPEEVAMFTSTGSDGIKYTLLCRTLKPGGRSSKFSVMKANTTHSIRRSSTFIKTPLLLLAVGSLYTLQLWAESDNKALLKNIVKQNPVMYPNVAANQLAGDRMDDVFPFEPTMLQGRLDAVAEAKRILQKQKDRRSKKEHKKRKGQQNASSPEFLLLDPKIDGTISLPPACISSSSFSPPSTESLQQTQDALAAVMNALSYGELLHAKHHSEAYQIPKRQRSTSRKKKATKTNTKTKALTRR